MLGAIKDLRQIVLLCREGQPLGERLGQWLAEAVDAFLAQEVASIEEALGLRSARGGVPWWREEAIRIRDRLLRDFASQCFSELSLSARARQIRLLAIRYRASAWRFDQNHDDMPSRYEGTKNAWLWRLFQTGAPVPLSERHLRTILGGATRDSQKFNSDRKDHQPTNDKSEPEAILETAMQA